MLFYDNIKALFRPEAVIVGFIVGGILLLVIEGLFRNKKHAIKDIDEITPGKSLVGCFQVFFKYGQVCGVILWVDGLQDYLL